MATHHSVLAQQLKKLRAATVAAAAESKAIATDRDLTTEARGRKLAVVAGRVAKQAHTLMTEIAETRREIATKAAARTPKRSSDPAEIALALRQLDQLHQLSDPQLVEALRDPGVRETVGRWATPFDAQRIEERMPQLSSGRFRVADIRDQLVEADFPERVEDDRRWLRDVDEMLADTVAIASRSAAGEFALLGEEAASELPIRQDLQSRHWVHHLVGDERALVGSDITLQMERDRVEAMIAGGSPPRAVPMPTTDSGRPTEVTQ